MEYECACCKKYDGVTYKKLRDEYAYKIADDIVSPYAHKDALESAKESCPNRGHMFNEHYLMYYRIWYDGMFGTAVSIFEEHYIANAVEKFKGDIEKTCRTFQQRYNHYKITGSALYRGGIYEIRHQQMYPELETAINIYYMSNHLNN